MFHKTFHFRKIIKYVLISILAVILSAVFVIFIGKAINKKAPKHGINNGMYVEINGTKQWICMYGQNIDNPVLLYLHGGPGCPTSYFDHAILKQWTDIYTVVTWDQRNCGKSYSDDQDMDDLSYETFMQDGLEMTQFLCKYFNKEKITLLGHSWGSVFGANLALKYPEYYTAFIGTGQLVDMVKNEQAFIEAAKTWIVNEPEHQKYIDSLEQGEDSPDYFYARQYLMQYYKYDMFADGRDYNMVASIIFNPYYSLSDFKKLLHYANTKLYEYTTFTLTEDFNKFSLLDKTEYKIPYFNINGDRDYQTNYIQAQEYFDKITAPKKGMYIMKNGTHGLLESRSKEFSQLLHQIAAQIQ